MSYIDMYDISEDFILGIDRIFQAREEIRQEAARLNAGLEKWNFANDEADQELEETIKALRNQRYDLDDLIVKWIPDWTYDPSSILQRMTRIALTIKDAWHFPIKEWDCSWDGMNPGTLRCTVSEKGSDNTPNIIPEVKVSDILPSLLKTGICTWNLRYEPDDIVLDGESWELSVDSPVGNMVITGENAWPEGFDMLCKVLDDACDIKAQGGRRVTLEEAFEIATSRASVSGKYTEYENGWIFDLAPEFDNMEGPWPPAILREEGIVRPPYDPMIMNNLGEEIGEGSMTE